MARLTNGMVSYADLDLMVTEEGYEYNPDTPPLPANLNKCVTTSEIEAYLFADVTAAFPANRLVAYQHIVRALSTNPISLAYGENGGLKTLTIKTNNAWTATEGVAWLSLSQTSGTGDLTINVTATQNTGVSRNTNITVTDTVTGAVTLVGVSQLEATASATTAVSLSEQSGSAATSCTVFNDGFFETLYIPQGQNFSNATNLYVNSTGTIDAGSGWYSNGVIARNWNGSSFVGGSTSC